MKPWIKAAYIDLEGGEDMPKTKAKKKAPKKSMGPIVTGKKATKKKK